MANPERDTVYLDGHCSYCRRAMRWLRRLDWLGRLDVRDLHATPEAELPVSMEVADSGMPMRTRDGRVLVGFPAMRLALRRTPLGLIPACLMYLPGIAHVGRRVYRRVASNRPCNAGACALPPERT
ncbi:MAG: thiol-disulfide oxidoreductase DCC family protein [Phycisphaerales bacterium JB059]